MKITSAHAIAFAALVVAVGGGIAVAHNGDTDKIHFCVDNTSGAVRAVQPDGACSANETAQDVRIQNVAYHTRAGGPAKYPAKVTRLVSPQLIVPGSGDSYVISGKLVVSKSGAGARAGIVTCRLTSTDNTPADTVRATVRPGESVPMSFDNTGKTDGRPGQSAATEISCTGGSSTFVVSNVQLTAVPVNTISKGIA
ncbi:MAG: hypothetical protein JWM73_197 [Solirubrobacterales bacterium]|nr:hypothetical protein [Solirubrobacterales bacterium]